MGSNTSFILGSVLFCLALPATGAEFLITQQGETFSELFLKIGNNDVVKFINQDSVTHKLSVSYKSKSHTFDDLSPGTSQAIEFNKPGLYDIECSIHENMKLTVFVPHIMKASLN